jgi:hypothetical protein
MMLTTLPHSILKVRARQFSYKPSSARVFSISAAGKFCTVLHIVFMLLPGLLAALIHPINLYERASVANDSAKQAAPLLFFFNDSSFLTKKSSLITRATLIITYQEEMEMPKCEKKKKLGEKSLRVTHLNPCTSYRPK